LVAHRLDDAPALLHHHHQRVVPWEDSGILVRELGSPQIGELAQRPFDLVAGDALALERRLGGLGLQRPVGVGQALALLEQFLLEPGGLLCVELVDQRLDPLLVLVRRLRESCRHGLRNGDPGPGASAPEDVAVVLDAELGAELPDVPAVVRPDLRRIAHVTRPACR
jgi:hypothetical protein